MNFDWKAFEEGELVYNARTEEDAKAFLKECDRRGIGKSFSLYQRGQSHWETHGEQTCYHDSIFGIKLCDVEYFRLKGIPIFSEPWKKQESVVEMLRSIKGASYAVNCAICHKVYDDAASSCDAGRSCSSVWYKLAGMVETELEEAKQIRCMGYIDSLDHLRRLPEREQGEVLEKYLARTHVVLPRWDNGEIVKEGDPYADTTVEHICVYSDGDWLLNMEDGSILEGTLNQRAVYVQPDTQERIDDEATNHPVVYCADNRINVPDASMESATTAMVSHLLERQRKLDAKVGEQRG